VRVRILGILSMLVILTGAGRVAAASTAGPFVPPFTRTWVGPHASPWFHLVSGAYDVSERNRPLGCADDIALVGTNGYHVVDIRPNFVPHDPAFHRSGQGWAGLTSHLVAGTYRIVGTHVTLACRWSMRITAARTEALPATHGMLPTRRATLITTAGHPLTVQTVAAFCRAHPIAHKRLWVRGWFVPSIRDFRWIDGGLFPSRQAVPAGVESHWDLNGRWKRYGALYAHITTQASFGTRRLTLHGRLACASFRFSSDRDPFPAPILKPVYRMTERGPEAPAMTTATAGGLRLTLTIPRRRYPHNALILVRATLRNVSHHDVGYWSPGVALPGVTAPQAEVLNQAGQVIFPPAMPFMPVLPGPPPTPISLGPGQSVTQRQYVILSGQWLRASQQFLPHLSTRVRRPENTLVTRPIRLRLYGSPAPGLSLRQTATGPVLNVTSPHPRGQPLVLAYADCGSLFDFYYSRNWVPSTLHMTPGCSPLHAWHVRLAWLNHPVTGIDYVVPEATQMPNPSPTPVQIAIPPTPSPTPQPVDALGALAGHGGR
jgi:hypothetical protein